MIINSKNITNSEVEKAIKASIATSPFPKPGVQFKDITTALKTRRVLQLMAIRFTTITKTELPKWWAWKAVVS